MYSRLFCFFLLIGIINQINTTPYENNVINDIDNTYITKCLSGANSDDLHLKIPNESVKKVEATLENVDYLLNSANYVQEAPSTNLASISEVLSLLLMRSKRIRSYLHRRPINFENLEIAMKEQDHPILSYLQGMMIQVTQVMNSSRIHEANDKIINDINAILFQAKDDITAIIHSRIPNNVEINNIFIDYFNRLNDQIVYFMNYDTTDDVKRKIVQCLTEDTLIEMLKSIFFLKYHDKTSN